jgi:membrane associated rhomboid family serine protease
MGNVALLTLMNFGVLGIAMTAPTEWAPPIGASAIIATTLGWFMFRNEKRQELLANRMEHVARSSYYVVLTSRAADALIKQDAKSGLNELDGKSEG